MSDKLKDEKDGKREHDDRGHGDDHGHEHGPPSPKPGPHQPPDHGKPRRHG
jgi:hypothetical protein